MHQHLVRLFRAQIEKLGNKSAMRVEQDGQWRSIGWRTFGQAMDYCAQALIRAGHQEGEMVGICSNNMPEWTQTDLGILAARGVVVPIYPTSTMEQVRYILQDAGIKTMFVGEQSQFDLCLPLLEQGELRQIIAFDSAVNLRGNANCIHFQEFLSSGNHAESQAERERREQNYAMNDLVTLIYTSGTTGTPKGVMLDFANIAASLEAHDKRLVLGHDDVSIAMLPLSHIFERAWTWYVLYRGAENIYLRDPQRVMEIIGEVKPTVMCSVPRLYEKAYAMIKAKVEKAPTMRRKLFNWAERVGVAMVMAKQNGTQPSPLLKLQHRLADKLVFSAIRARFGGNTRFLPVAGARLADEVNLFFQAAGLNLKYGYGMTETCATVCCFDDQDFRLGSIGTPLDGIEVKLGENNELLVRAPTIMRGYYNKPEATAETFTEDGFLRTGDAGDIDAQGNIYFSERLKELMKTSNGKYIAPQVVEGALNRDRFIEQVAIIADGRHFVSALIVPCVEALEEYAQSLNIKYHNQAELLRNSKVVHFFEERVQALQTELAKFEQVKRFTLLPRAFSMELGEITPTMKLRRRVIETTYQDEINEMYNAAKK